MASLEIYDKFGSLLETHSIDTPLSDWLKAEVKSYYDTVRPPYSARLNGEPWPYVFHEDKLKDSDVVAITIEPNGSAIYWAYLIITIAAAVYAYNRASNLPRSYENSTEPGVSIYNANARANSVKPSGIIREAAGSYPIFPDIICPVRRKFIDHQEFLYLMLSVSSGYMFLREKNIYIAETPITNYAGDYLLSIFEPNEDVSGHEAYENWFESREVSGLELITSTNELPGNWTATYSGDQMTTYIDGVLVEFPFPVDSIIEITSGSNQGVYSVSAIGSPNHTATLVAQDVASSVDVVTRNISRIVNNNSRRTGGATGRGPHYPIPSRSGRGPDRRTFSDEASTSLTSVSPAEPITFKALKGGINWEGPFEVVPENETARYMEFDVNFPGGLVTVNNDGDQVNRTVEIVAQYRAVGSATWTTITDTSRSPNTTIYTDNTFDERGYTVEVDFGSAIRPEVRFRRVTQEPSEATTTDDVYISRVRSLLESPTSYPVTTIALRLRGTNALAVTSENKVNVRRAVRKLPTLQEIQNAADGTAFDLSASNTQTTDTHIISSTAEFLGVSQVSSSDFYPDSTISRGSGFVDGSNLLTYDSVLRWFTLEVSERINSVNTYRSYSTAASSDKPRNAMYADSGDKVVAMELAKAPSNGTTITQFDLSTSYDVSTATAVTSYSASWPSEISDGAAFYMNSGGTKFWIADANDNTIYQYTNSSAYDFSTASQDLTGSPQTAVGFDTSTELALVSPSATLISFWMTATKLWVLDSSSSIHYYTMTSEDVSTASYQSTSSIASDVSNPYSIQVASDYLYVTEVVSGEIFVHSWQLDSVTDSRSSQSLVRFAANAIYDAIGSEVKDIVDWSAMSSLDTLLESRLDYFNGEFVDETTLWEALRVIFAPGYSEPAMKEGKLTPVRTSAGSDYTHIYTPDIMLDDGLTINDDYYDGIDVDGIDVEYLDENSNQNEIVECRLTGDMGVRARRIQSIGITNRTRAWRYGMRERRQIFYKPANYTFSTEMDALNSEYGDAIAVASDIFTGQSGSVTAASGNSITLDFTPDYGSTSPIPTFFAAFKKPDGKFSGLYTISPGSPNNVITITSSPGLDFTPVTDASPDSDGENTLVVLGTSDQWGRRAIVRSVRPQGNNEVQVVAEEYVSNLFDSDDSAPP